MAPKTEAISHFIKFSNSHHHFLNFSKCGFSPRRVVQASGKWRKKDQKEEKKLKNVNIFWQKLCAERNICRTFAAG
jgi:hypothetical protein